ncbi:MAG: phosphoribosylamine--glycine ligase [Deltaproteobacteria bacterium CG11_big_fil_rev_8_21_14_0_20_45_16]|nr:MAG: phosphoribosylamine--glycine ligase [Deltaproteobacteria bacterium CG11_big_fil_rev_8_21_14_0_20_45_16]
MKVLVLGSGGREHALVWHLLKQGHQVEAAPGSDAISSLCKVWNFENFEQLKQRCIENHFEFLIVGPEKYLCDGIADFMASTGIQIIGPTKSSSKLESDKSWAKSFCERYGIPTARSLSLKSANEIEDALKQFRTPYVIKASGLAAGKGVLITNSLQDAREFGELCLKSHDSIVIEDYIQGEEVSCFYLVRDKAYCFIGAAQDHKRLSDNDTGPNTGGMGAYSPPPFFNNELLQQVERQIVQPTIKGLETEGLEYKGFLFLGLMISGSDISLLEYNCRLGDPETQSILMKLDSDIITMYRRLATEFGNQSFATFNPGVAMNVVIAAKGYPEAPMKGFALPEIQSDSEELKIFHSGTSRSVRGYEANGGRLFSVACLEESLLECQNRIYNLIESFKFLDHVSFRRDIGTRAYKYLLPTKRVSNG